MRRVAATLEDQGLYRPAGPPLNRLHLPQCAVSIVLALDHQHGTANLSQAGFDIPPAEPRLQPDIGPAVEGRVDIPVPGPEPLAQGSTAVGRTSPLDPSDGHLLDKDVGRLQHQAAHRPPPVCGIEKGDGGAVAVTDQHRSADLRGLENGGQGGERLAFEVVDLPRLAEDIGAAVTVAGVDQRARTGPLAEPVGEVAPQLG